MPVNTLTAQAGLRIGPVVLETLVKHYFERLRAREGKGYTNLREEEMLYDQAFGIARAFLSAASHHTVEEVQAFANTWTPSPPWVHVIRLTIPMSCCNEAAAIIIQAFGGEENTRRVVGGVKWWQVRGREGVDAQWITAKKDWREAKKRHKRRNETPNAHHPDATQDDPEGPEMEEMDQMRCILYSHGGGYYFGSVDQERYSIQRHARKINGRVFAVDYRLAPQYPFPCALQDLVAAYLYLIRPPPDAKHKAVKPCNIVIAGDSAGGGMSLALLQIIRDTGLPPPAGGVLISPWCDLTHSFPSIHTNTDTDVIPPWGLSLQKPSPLWPPPSDELATQVRHRLRSRVKHALHIPEHNASIAHLQDSSSSIHTPIAPVDVGTITTLPEVDPSSPTQKITLKAKNGEMLVIDQQVQLYTQNSMLNHPLISSALSYLGGLPPLLFIASEKEVLRDEILYAAHKAARPNDYPVKEEIRRLYPPLEGIEKRYVPTQVHLQVYDDSAHVLPVLFSFTTPAKYCYRAIASFVKHVTAAPIPTSHSGQETASPLTATFDAGTSETNGHPSFLSMDPSASPSHQQRTRNSLRRSFSANFKRATSSLRRSQSRPRSLVANDEPLEPLAKELRPPLPTSVSVASTSSDVAGPRFTHHNTPPRVASPESASTPRLAGDASIYADGFINNMIRERVSTHGEIRALEPEKELDALLVPPELVGTLSELSVRRYIDGKLKFDKKYVHAAKAVDKQRRRTLEQAKKDTSTGLFSLQTVLQPGGVQPQDQGAVKEGLALSSNSWGWAWLIDGNEHPPPSSIAARRDTDEARRLALVADQAVMPEAKALSANNLWSVIVDFLTVAPGSNHTEHEKDKDAHQSKPMLSRLFSPKKKATITPLHDPNAPTHSDLAVS